MAAVKNNRQLALQIPQKKGPESIESRFLGLHDNAEVKQSLLRELVYVGTILRSFPGVTQHIMDLERSGELQAMDAQEQRNAIASIIAGSTITQPSQPPAHTPEANKEEAPRVEASGLSFGA